MLQKIELEVIAKKVCFLDKQVKNSVLGEHLFDLNNIIKFFVWQES